MAYGIKSCPFCGGDADVIDTPAHPNKMGYAKSGHYEVACLKCGCRTPMLSEAGIAVSYWNRRANDAR